jgi:hypothetical protein
VLIPELFACKKVYAAKKRTADGVYFSGITVEQLLWCCTVLPMNRSTRPGRPRATRQRQELQLSPQPSRT